MDQPISNPPTSPSNTTDRDLGRYGLLVLRVVIDVIQQCNLRCRYCHPGKVWLNEHLSVETLCKLFASLNDFGPLEVVLSGGEITMHPEFNELLEATGLVRRPALTMITNATLVDKEKSARIADSNVRRICVSLDGADSPSHASARGHNFSRVLEGLRLLRSTGKEITVISVAHQGNYRQVTAVSHMLASDGLADQHHICAPVFSGTARQHYNELKLHASDYRKLQESVEAVHSDLLRLGLFVTFNSLYPATGSIPSSQCGRTLTLQQLAEQQKDSNIHVRPSGDVRLPVLGWGRETVGAATIGNVRRQDPTVLLQEADARLRAADLQQLRREDEAEHKFQLTTSEHHLDTNSIVDSEADPRVLVELVPIRRLEDHPILRNALDLDEIDRVISRFRTEPQQVRGIRHATGIVAIFQRDRSFVTLLSSDEGSRLGLTNGSDHNWPTSEVDIGRYDRYAKPK